MIAGNILDALRIDTRRVSKQRVRVLAIANNTSHFRKKVEMLLKRLTQPCADADSIPHEICMTI